MGFRGKYDEREEKKGENDKEKERKGKDNEKMGSKRFKKKCKTVQNNGKKGVIVVEKPHVARG